jgi:hypothetical protein
MLLQQLERGAAFHAVDRKGSSQGNLMRGVLVLDAGHQRVVVNSGTLIDEVPDQRLVGLGISHVVTVVWPNQVRRVAFVHQVLGVVDAVLVDQRVDDAERHRTVGADPDRNPFMRLARLRGLERVEDDILESAVAGISDLRGILHGNVAGAVPLGATEVQGVVAVGEVGNDRPRDMHDAVHEVGAVTAVQAAAGNPVIRGAECLHEGDDPEPDLGGLCGRSLEEQAPGIPFLALPQLLVDGIERLFPANTYELRIDVEALLRVGPFQRVVDPVGIVE